MSKFFKTAEDFGGYWLKGLKEFKGHEGEPLIQAGVYFNNKKIGFFSESSTGGPCRLDIYTREVENILVAYAADHTGNDFEPEHGFLVGIADAILTRKYYMTRCRTKCLYRKNSSEEATYISMNLKWKGNEDRIRKHLNKKVGEGKYIIINEEL